jgi:GNAT superfamily N-acetyltransferase
MATAFTDISVSPVTTEDHFQDLFAVTAAAFGGQTNDAFWTSIYPGWDTTEGAARGAERMKTGWRNTQHDKDGRPYTVMLQASIPTPDEQGRRIVGVAIWCQYSVVEGHGVKPIDGTIDQVREKLGLTQLYPDDEDKQRYVARGWQCLTADRNRAIQEASTREIPATFVLDILAVHPDAQKRGIAGRLAGWGLEEAHRRGGLECTTEGSKMGRSVYAKLGMRPVKQIEWDMGDTQKEGYRDMPDNVFMSTGFA